VFPDARTITGVVGQIKWSYYVAAGVEGFTAMRQPAPRGVKPTWTLSARIVGSDKFKMAQRPLIFVAPLARGRWVWEIREFSIVGDRMIASLGPREDY
jgi:hypothetical protein